MNIAYIILIVIVVLFFIFLFFDITYNKFQDYIIRIKDVESKIDNILDTKFNNILKINNIIKEKIQTEKEIINDISSLKEENKSSSEIDNTLNDALEKIGYIKDQYDELDNEEELNSLFDSIEKDNESLIAYKKYFNDNTIKYNELTSKFPYGITAKLFKYKKKDLFSELENIEQ